MNPTGRRRGRVTGRDRGSVATEIALVYPVVLLMILTAVQVGVWWYASHLAHAAADTALATARGEDATEQQAQQAAAGFLAQAGGDGLLSDVAVQVERDDTRATVRVEAAAAQVVPGLSLPVTVELTAPVDRFVEGG